MNIALIVGIDYYEQVNCLNGCVNDAENVEKILARHDDTKNFDCHLLISTESDKTVKRAALKDKINELFKRDAEIASLYFAGHGHIESTGGYLLTSEVTKGDEDVSLNDILTFANESPAKNKIIILDSCHSGIAGTSPVAKECTSLAEGITILTASTKDQYASEQNGH